ncbi:unnamed protein product [Cyclocybe aegerita]|uniref:Uncharacterized protein n=1 Tax=Cyclocybe aegerita TaxID=1973307 RepID=A0A8S0X0T9_CYCAE|nr:unnamed protein product [Cyclocybe aegerita]
MPSNLSEFKQVDLRIRTLTAILQSMHQAEPAQSTRRDVPPLLRHMATLLTCGSNKDPKAAQVVAIAGVVEERSIKALVVTQNAAAKESTPFSLKGHQIVKSNESFDAIISGPASVPLERHIVDLLALLPSCNLNDEVQVESLMTFVTMRSIRKLHARLTSDEKIWNIRVAQILTDWKPAEGDYPFEPFWVSKPVWPVNIDRMRSMMEKRGEGDSEEWLFSMKSIGIWANTLGTMLSVLESYIKEYKGFPQDLREKPMKASKRQLKKDVQEKLGEINAIVFSLYRFLTKHVLIVKKILAQKSLEAMFLHQKVDVLDGQPTGDLDEPEGDPDEPARDLDVADEMDDEHLELTPEGQETEGNRVYRYLQTIAAWQAAIEILLQPKYRAVLASISVGLVEVSGRETGLMNRDEFAAAFLARATATSDDEVEIRGILTSFTPTQFGGTIHAEASLMGLLAYFSHPDTTTGKYIDDMDADALKTLFEPVLAMATTPTIGVGKKCCWCCYKLAQLLKARQQEILLPGTHGVLYAWCPPRVGVDIQVLKIMEKELWEKLERVVAHRLAQRSFVKTHSRQSSGELQMLPARACFYELSRTKTVKSSTRGLTL